jgi:hypothetical protein
MRDDILSDLEETHDISNIILKPKVNHPIRFVHAEIFAVIECKSFLLEHIDQTTWSGNNNVDTLIEDVTLLVHGDATNTEECV